MKSSTGREATTGVLPTRPSAAAGGSALEDPGVDTLTVGRLIIGGSTRREAPDAIASTAMAGGPKRWLEEE